MADDKTSPWQSARRALARLVSGTRVRELPLAGLLPAPAVAAPATPFVSAPVAGAVEPDWRPGARVAEVSLPLASAGAGEADLAPVPTVMRLDAAPSPEGAGVHAAALPPLACTTHRLGGAALGWQTREVPSPMVVFLPGVVRGTVCFRVPDTARLPLAAPSLPRVPRRPGHRPQDPLRLAGGRVRPGMATVAELPLKRDRRPAPPGVTMADAFAPELMRLAEKAGAVPGDVVLVGIFPQVPVAAVRRLALEENGTLCLWLKPDALVAASASRTPRLATLIVGRLRSTGKMIQAAA